LDSTSDGNTNPAAAAIREEIARSGPISFARFMELALYHPDHGYYRYSPIGKRGDFFTSVSVGNLFGRMLAFYLERKLDSLNAPLQIIEAGANDGSLARDILDWFGAREVRYIIIEPISRLRDLQRKTLAGLNIQWFTSLDELSSFEGAFISNELLDAFPVQVFSWNRPQNQWQELGVNENLQWTPLRQSSTVNSAPSHFKELAPLEPYLPDGYRIELSPSAESFWHQAAAKLQRGLLLAIDYGDEHLWTPDRPRGTLRAYHNHKLVDNVLANPGQQDITASVNFARIRAVGEHAGLASDPLETQAKFLASFAGDYFKKELPQTRQFQTLTHPEHLGRAFKVLGQFRINS